MATTLQCSGTTKAGRRCQIMLKDGSQRCQYHRNQSTNPSSVESKPGFVYIYALEPGRGNVHIYSAQTQSFEKIKVHHQEEGVWTKIKRVVASPDAKPLLIKVGFTTALPAKRLEQWHQQCKHNIELVIPQKRHTRAYDFDVLGWPCLAPHAAEQRIHQQLWDRYGKGHVECGGCNEGRMSIHREWFLIPRHELKHVFATVDQNIIDCNRKK